jgi:tryptophanyl-tRNA synthetase
MIRKKPGISNLLVIYTLLIDKDLKEAEKELENDNYHQFKSKIVEILREALKNLFAKRSKEIIFTVLVNNYFLEFRPR